MIIQKLLAESAFVADQIGAYVVPKYIGDRLPWSYKKKNLEGNFLGTQTYSPFNVVIRGTVKAGIGVGLIMGSPDQPEFVAAGVYLLADGVGWNIIVGGDNFGPDRKTRYWAPSTLITDIPDIAIRGTRKLFRKNLEEKISESGNEPKVSVA